MKNNDSNLMRHKVFNSSDYGISEVMGVSGIIARLWRNLLHDTGTKEGQFESMLDDFVQGNKKHYALNRVTRMLTKGNLRREIFNPVMTFKVFMKGLKILRVVEFTVAVKVKFRSQREAVCQVNVNLEDIENEKELYNE